MRAGVVNGVTLMIPKVTVPILNAKLYPVWFNLAKCFTTVDDDSVMSNERLNKIFLNQLKKITQASTLQKKSIKRFVSETFYQGHEKIRLNPYSNKKAVVLFYAVYLIGKSKEEVLDDSILQKILKKSLLNLNGESFIVDNEMENKLKQIMMEDVKYSDVLEIGAEKIMNWQN